MKSTALAVKNSGRMLRFFLCLLTVALCLIPVHILAEDGRHEGGRKLRKIKHIIVVYQENWSFDSLYGLFPGANGLRDASITSLTQTDRLTGKPYSSQLGQPFDLVTGSLTLTTPPQPINNNVTHK